MAGSLEECVQRGHEFTIVDEVDNILIDEARTPLIISGAAEEFIQQLVHTLERGGLRIIPRPRPRRKLHHIPALDAPDHGTRWHFPAAHLEIAFVERHLGRIGRS
jgi:hypothetical protein